MSFFRKIAHFFESIFRSLRKPAKTAIHIGVVVTEKIKNFVEGPQADFITTLIPGTIDDAIREKLKTAIPDILVKLKLADECADEHDPEKLTACAIKTLQLIGKPFQNDFLDALAVQISLVAADGKLTWDEAKSVLKYYYDHEWKKDKSDAPPASVTEETTGDTEA